MLDFFKARIFFVWAKIRTAVFPNKGLNSVCTYFVRTVSSMDNVIEYENRGHFAHAMKWRYGLVSS